jgi:cytidylate kinase
MTVKIAISGGPGTGTSSLAKSLARALQAIFEISIPTHSTGTICRNMAHSAGISLEEFQLKMVDHAAHDYMIDNTALNILRESCYIIESRLAAWQTWKHEIQNVFSVHIVADLETRAQRIQKDRRSNMRPSESKSVSIEKIKEEITLREIRENERYERLYGNTNYTPHIIVDSSKQYGLDINRTTLITIHHFLVFAAKNKLL